MSKLEKTAGLVGMVIIGFIAVIITSGIIGTTGSGTDTNSSQANDSNSSDKTSSNAKPATAKIGQAARDGKFEFTVKSIDCGKTQLGDQYFNTKAQGQFCLVDVKVENIGDEPQSLFDDNQYAFNANGQKYSADSEAAIYLNDSASKIYEEINPGNTVTGKIIFDVPKDTKLTSLELHDSAFSSGVKVSLK